MAEQVHRRAFNECRLARVRESVDNPRGEKMLNIMSNSNSRKKLFGDVLSHGILIVLCGVFLVPLAWAVLTSLKSMDQAFAIPAQLIPNPFLWSNYVKVFYMGPFAKFIANSTYLVGINVLGHIVSVSLVAFGFARLRFPGRNFLFMILLASLMIPYHVTLIPSFIIFNKLGWVNSFLPLTVPAFTGSAYQIFLMRQYMMSIPLELDEAARIDGCGTFQLFSRIMIPLCRPPLTVISVLTVTNVWNDFFGPLIYLNDVKKYTLSLGLSLLQGMYETDWPILMAATVMSVIPMLVLYFCVQRHLIGGFASVGIKG